MEHIEHRLKIFAWYDDQIKYLSNIVEIPPEIEFNERFKKRLSFLATAPKIGKTAKYINSYDKNNERVHVVESWVYINEAWSKYKKEILNNGYKILREYEYGKF